MKTIVPDMISEADAERISVAVAKALQAARSVSDSEHYGHHKWISAKRAREEAWRDVWVDLRKHVLKWGAVSLLTGFFYVIWLGIKAMVRS